jgi:N-acetylglucosaminyldiphosphoundecaprenol N-acetyl-beta-D-mannosaminyltransferase
MLMEGDKLRIHVFGIDIDAINAGEAVRWVLDKCRSTTQECEFVVTPNIDHIVKLKDDVYLKMAYSHASLVLTDGRPLRLAARLLGREIPEVIPGSDLVPMVFDASVTCGQELRVFLFGAAAGVGIRAKSAIEARWGRSVSVVGVLSPSFVFEKNRLENQEIVEEINRAKPDLLVIGLGAPKQELWISEHSAVLKVKVALCVGATIDFVAGERRRAPVWVRTLGLEWAFRIWQEPSRLAGRYAYDALIFPGIFLKELGRNLRSSTRSSR